MIACKNTRFSSLFVAGDVLSGETYLRLSGRNSILMAQVNVYIINMVVVPNMNLSNFMSLLVDFGKVLCSPANELQQNSILLLEKTIFHKY